MPTIFNLGQPTLYSVILNIRTILNYTIPVIITLALIYFLWGVGRFILSAGDEQKRGEARNIMVWGIIALFVMVSVWGLVNVLVSTFGLRFSNLIVPPPPQF